MHHFRMSVWRSSSQTLIVRQKRGFQDGRQRDIEHTLRLEELQLTVEELKVRLGEDNLRNVVVTRATAHIARLGVGISGVDAILQV